MTDRVFDDRPGLESLETTVLSCTPAGKEWDIRLESTVFFPRGGGQPCEGGTIGDARVLDVFYDEGGDILHRVDRQVAPGPVKIAINGEKRWEYRQQHSAQHLLSAAIHRLFGMDTVIARIEEPDAHIELPAALTPAQLCEALAEARRMVERDIPFRCYYVTPEEAAQMAVRGRITPHARIRLVEIEDYDRNACGGTHVERTGQIGPMRFTGTKEVRGLFRVYYRAGVRCEGHDRQAERTLLELGLLAGVHTPEETVEKLTENAAELRRLTEKEQQLKESLAAWQRGLLQTALAQGGGTACLLVPACDPKSLRTLADQMAKEAPAVFALVVEGAAPAVLLLRSKGPGPDLGAALRQLLARFPGKGGGGPVLAQATLEPDTDPAAVLEHLKELLN